MKQIENWKQQFSDIIPGLDIMDFKLDEHPDSLIMSFVISGEHLTQQSGDFVILHPDIFRKANAPEITKLERQQPIWFGPPQEFETYITWRIPQQWITQEDTFKIQDSCKGAAMVLETICSPGLLRHHSAWSAWSRCAGRLDSRSWD